MLQWLQDRYGIFRLSLRHAALLRVFTLLQAAFLLLKFIPPSSGAPFLRTLTGIPWWAWAMGWMAVLWLTSLEYSLERKKNFDRTSLNFFKAYLDFLIHGGRRLFDHSEGKDFHARIKDWQHQAILGIAIGMGPGESERFFHQMEDKNPLQEAYRKSQGAGSNEPLCRVLQDHLDELAIIRAGLPEKENEISETPGALVKAGPDGPGPAVAPGSGVKRLPPSSKDDQQLKMKNE